MLVDLGQAIRGGQLFLDQLGEFPLFARQGNHIPLHFRQFRFQVGKLRRRQTLLDRHRRFRSQAISRQDFPSCHPLSGVGPQGSDNPLKGQIDAAFQGAE